MKMKSRAWSVESSFFCQEEVYISVVVLFPLIVAG